MPKAGQFGRKAQELTGEILVNKQNFHMAGPKAAVSNALVYACCGLANKA